MGIERWERTPTRVLRMLGSFFEKYWLWLTFPLFVAIILASHEVGYRVGRRVDKHQPADKDEALSDLTGSAIGLLGLMLAFTFGWTASRYDALRLGRLEEAQAITELYRLGDLLPAQERSRLRAILMEYVTVSLRGHGDIAASLQFREDAHRELWKIATSAARTSETPEIGAALLDGTTQVLNAHYRRAVRATTSTIPRSIVVGLIGVLVCTMALVGYRAGMRGAMRSRALVPVAVSVALVCFLIADLNRPVEGFARISVQPLLEAQREMRNWP